MIKKLTIIIPVFNEEKTIQQVVRRVSDLRLPNIKKEILIINDGSTDSTKQKLDSLKKSQETIVIHSKKNEGKGSAVIKGIKQATGDYIVIQDADLEYHPKFIQELLEPLSSDNGVVVYGTRLRRFPNLQKEESTPLFLLHYFGNRMLSLITSILYGSWITDMETCYKLFPKSSVKNMILRAKGFEFEPEITAKLLKGGNKIIEVPIITIPRGKGEGKKLRTFYDGSKGLIALLKYRFVD